MLLQKQMPNCKLIPSSALTFVHTLKVAKVGMKDMCFIFSMPFMDTVFHIIILDTVVTFINPINVFLLSQLEHFYGLDKDNNQQLSGE